MITTALLIEVDDLEPETVQAIHDACAKILAQASGVTPAPEAVLGWTPALAGELDARLRSRNRPVQADTIKAEAAAGGSVDRATVYEVGGYDPKRSLNGFTKPVRGVMAELIAEGLLPADAAHPMKPTYDPNIPSYQRAKGFKMPPELASVFHSAHTG
jgi:hypothetical protein